MTQNTFFVEWLNNNELQVFISIRSLKFLNQCLCNGSTSFKPFELRSPNDDTFEKLLMIKSNHHSKSVNNLNIADQLSKIRKYQRSFHFTGSYYVACSSSTKYVGRSDV